MGGGQEGVGAQLLFYLGGSGKVCDKEARGSESCIHLGEEGSREGTAKQRSWGRSLLTAFP